MAILKKDKYNADSIQILEGTEAIRKRPGIYRGYRCKRVTSPGV